MITRKDYMADSANLHHSYYLQFATESTYSLIKTFVGGRDYDSIPLHSWDRISEMVRRTVDKRLLGSVTDRETIVSVEFVTQNGETRTYRGSLNVGANKSQSVAIKTDNGWKRFSIDRVTNIEILG